MKQQGFTLLELLVVLVIAGLLLSLTPPLISAALPGVQLKSSARQLAAALRYARSYAVVQQQEALVEIDVESRTFRVSGRDRLVSLPKQLTLKLFAAQSELKNNRIGAIRFFTDGSSTGGRVTILHKQRGYVVDVDWLTGYVQITAKSD